jgi:two-component system, LytTR family, response regulator
LGSSPVSASSKELRLRVLIVDDEPLAREGLRMLLVEDPAAHVVLEAKNGSEAVDALRKEQLDIVFLDVQMPEMDGFAVVHEVGPANMPGVIFVTAHDQYAIQAFEINAVDYLLKPVTRERFQATLARARSRLRTHAFDRERIASLLESIDSPSQKLSRIAVRSAGKTYFVALEEVEWIKAAENYVELHVGLTRHLLHVRIHKLECSLDPEMFMRIHRSFIVNVKHIKEIEPVAHGEHALTLRSGVRLKSSRSYDQSIRRWADNPF